MLTLQHLLWIFLVYSFLGWLLETAAATLNLKTFANRGVINGPFCMIYGVGAVIISAGLKELTGFWLFLFAAIYATVIEWIAGHLIEKFFQERLWDYSKRKLNFDGYICLSASLLWGVFGYDIVTYTNRLLFAVVDLIPSVIENIILLLLLVLLGLDLAASFLSLGKQSGLLTLQRQKRKKAENKIAEISRRCSGYIAAHIESRVKKAYPKSRKVKTKELDKSKFADGCGFYKIAWLFFIGAFGGDIVETVFCRLTAGVWMSRSSVVWGDFSIVWGLAIAVATALLYQYRNKDTAVLFLAGTMLGGGYEYLCSVFTEVVFGKVFWDYSKMPFNLGGRVNLLYCFFWGIALVIWLKKLYPVLSNWIEKIPVTPGMVITWLLIVFMVCDMAMSAAALSRYEERSNGIAPQTALQSWLDEKYSDEKMNQIYPNAINAE